EARDLAERTRARKLKAQELSGATFSISNLGMFDVAEFSAIINPPEGAILAVGSVRRVPVVEGESVTVGRRMALTLSCDHRVMDGAMGPRFLQPVKRYREEPRRPLVGSGRGRKAVGAADQVLWRIACRSVLHTSHVASSCVARNGSVGPTHLPPITRPAGSPAAPLSAGSGAGIARVG